MLIDPGSGMSRSGRLRLQPHSIPPIALWPRDCDGLVWPPERGGAITILNVQAYTRLSQNQIGH
jgi:hypothetical protein